MVVLVGGWWVFGVPVGLAFWGWWVDRLVVLWELEWVRMAYIAVC